MQCSGDQPWGRDLSLLPWVWYLVLWPRGCSPFLGRRAALMSLLAGPTRPLPLQKQNFFQQMMHSLNQRR